MHRTRTFSSSFVSMVILSSIAIAAGPAACGGNSDDDRGGGGTAGSFSTSVPRDRSIDSLSSDEAEALCNDVRSALNEPAARADTCRFSAVLAAALDTVVTPDITDADLQAQCSTRYTECLAEALEPTCNQLPAQNCPATVAQYGTCVGDTIAAFRDIASQLPDCASVTKAGLTQDPEGGVTSAIISPASCRTFEANCTGLSPEAQAFADQYCAQLEPCCTAASLGSGCMASVVDGTRTGTFDATRAQACLDALATRATDTDFCDSLRPADDFAPWRAAVPECLYVIAPTPAPGPGEPCTRDTDCAPDPAPNGSALCGFSRTCVQTTRGSAGDPCIATINPENGLSSWNDTTATSGAVCHQLDSLRCDAATSVCVPTGAQGEPCAEVMDCGGGLHCDFGAGTCQPRLPPGSACDVSFGACAGDSYCDTITSVCTATLPAGAACSIAIGEESARCASGVCADGVCASPLAAICGE